MGEPPEFISFDESGFAYVQTANCLGADGGVLNLISCDSPATFHASAGGTAVQYYTGSDQWEARSEDDVGGFATLLTENDASAAGTFSTIDQLRDITINRNGSVWIEADGRGVDGRGHGIFRVEDGAATPWVHFTNGNAIAGNFPGTAELGTPPQGPRYPVSNKNNELGFVWAVRDASEDGVASGAGILRPGHW